MNMEKLKIRLSVGMLWFSALSLLSVALMAFANPQSVMDLVHVKLENTDAISSIRGVYGGAGLTLVIILIWLSFKDSLTGVKLMTVFWGLYALSRLMTILIEGPLGAFGSQWIMIETIFCGISALLWIWRR